MSQKHESQDEAAWELLLQARDQDIDPYFPQRVRRAAVASSPPSIWERIGLRPLRRPIALGLGGLATATAVVLASFWLLSSGFDKAESGNFASLVNGTPETVMATAMLPDRLDEVPEVVALEEEFDGIGELVELASTSDISSLRDDEIERLLFF